MKAVDSSTAEARWNGLFASVQDFGITIDNKRQAKILAGDEGQINDLLSELFELDNNPKSQQPQK